MDIRNSPCLTVLLRRRALSCPDQDALIHVRDAVTGTARHLAWKNLDHHARRIGATLRSRLASGARVLILLPSTGHAVPFIGCLYAGMVAVPVPLPGRVHGGTEAAPLAGRRRYEQAWLAAVAADCGAELVLTSPAARKAVTRWLRETGLRLEILTLDADGLDGPLAWSLPRLDHHTTALLQYDPGGGAEVRGVALSHGKLLSGAAEMYEDLDVAPEARFGGWLPLHSSAGLTMQTLTPLLYGSTAALMDPVTFLRRPTQWLHMIDRYDLAWSAAPHSAYDLCRRRVTDDELAALDLSRWRHAVTDASPTPGTAAFAARFAVAGLRPGALSVQHGRSGHGVIARGADIQGAASASGRRRSAAAKG